MRGIFVQVPREEGARVRQIAKECGGSNVSLIQAVNEDDREVALIVVHLPNSGVGPFFGALDPVEDVHLAFAPLGVLTLRPPARGWRSKSRTSRCGARSRSSSAGSRALGPGGAF